AAQKGVTAIAAGQRHTVALRNDGAVVAWGDHSYGQATVPLEAQSGVTAIASGTVHTLALKNDGSVLAWGKNEFGQSTVPAAAQGQFRAIAAGWEHSIVLVVPSLPVITAQPINQEVKVWQSARFTVVATGYPLDYQWRKDG